MADIKLKNLTGGEVTYTGVQTVALPTEEGTAVFSFGEAGTAETEADFSSGDMTLTSPSGTLWNRVTISKPETLVPENILSGVTIAGITGTATGGTAENTGAFAYTALDLSVLGDSGISSLDFSGTCSPAGARVYLSFLPEGTETNALTLVNGLMEPANLMQSFDDNGRLLPAYADSDSGGSWALSGIPCLFDETGRYVAWILTEMEYAETASVTLAAAVSEDNFNGANFYVICPEYGFEGNFDTLEEAAGDIDVDYGTIKANETRRIIRLTGKYTLTEDVTLPFGHTLIIGADTDEGATDWALKYTAAEAGSLVECSKLTVPEGVTLTVQGNLIVDGTQQVGAPTTGAPTGLCGALEVNGSLVLKEPWHTPDYADAAAGMFEENSEYSGILYAIGRIYGSGSAEINGLVYQPFVIRDWAGTLVSVAVMNEYQVFPFSLYEFNQIALTCVYEENAAIIGLFACENSGETFTDLVPVFGIILTTYGSEESLIYDNRHSCQMALDEDGNTVLTALVEATAGDYRFCLTYLRLANTAISSEGMATPFGYRVKIEQPNSCFHTDGSLKLLPGCTLRISFGDSDTAPALLAYTADAYKSGYNCAGWAGGADAVVQSSDNWIDIMYASTDSALSNVPNVTAEKDEDGTILEDFLESWGWELKSTTIPEYNWETNQPETVTFYYYGEKE